MLFKELYYICSLCEVIIIIYYCLYFRVSMRLSQPIISILLQFFHQLAQWSQKSFFSHFNNRKWINIINPHLYWIYTNLYETKVFRFLQVFVVGETLDEYYFVINSLPLARFVNLHIEEYTTAACLRVEFYGCIGSQAEGIILYLVFTFKCLNVRTLFKCLTNNKKEL